MSSPQRPDSLKMMAAKLAWILFLSFCVARCERKLTQGTNSRMSHELLQEAKAHAQGNLSRAISSIEVTFFSNESTVSDYGNSSCPNIVVIPNVCQSRPDGVQASDMATAFPFSVRNLTTDGLNLFYREAGTINAPVVLLLHGFPSSSHQFRNLIPILATSYRVLAPDLPGFGFTVVPKQRAYIYTFANLATTVESFLDALHVESFALYLFDFGAPTGMRIALRRPNNITALIAQNGNVYTEGFGAQFWAPIMKYWRSGSQADREALIPLVFSLDATRSQYTTGSPMPWTIAREAYDIDWYLLSNITDQQYQLDLFYDYRTNVDMYPEFQQFLREYKPPLLIAWGKNDIIFPASGAEAFKRDIPDAEIHLLDAGHFALETNLRDIGLLMMAFLKRRGI